jgi:hypothetical protein
MRARRSTSAATGLLRRLARTPHQLSEILWQLPTVARALRLAPSRPGLSGIPQRKLPLRRPLRLAPHPRQLGASGRPWASAAGAPPRAPPSAAAAPPCRSPGASRATPRTPGGAARAGTPPCCTPAAALPLARPPRTTSDRSGTDASSPSREGRQRPSLTPPLLPPRGVHSHEHTPVHSRERRREFVASFSARDEGVSMGTSALQQQVRAPAGH